MLQRHAAAANVPDSLNDLCQKVIGAAIDVHRALGPGLLEAIYEAALAIELTERRIPFQRQPEVEPCYKGQQIGKGRLDFLVDGELVLELKAVEILAPVHTAQVLAYLRATGHRLALLMNFNVAVLKDGIQRVIL